VETLGQAFLMAQMEAIPSLALSHQMAVAVVENLALVQV
jgi:hypothetical protein